MDRTTVVIVVLAVLAVGGAAVYFRWNRRRRTKRLTMELLKGYFEAHGPHQAGNRAAGHIEALALQLPPDLADPVDPEVRLKHAPDLLL